MVKKTKSKQRLDQYYRFAKTQGYRSRAAYKLIQLNRKYNFLNNASAVIDLCAAPGGWMQVAANTMPPNSTIIGVDLDDIKKVPGTMSFKGDITRTQTFDRLKKQLKNKKVDAVLNDGAPNVGANWSKDAYTQSQLVLASFKLACDFLKEGGHFVTKVFRSTDTNSLMWVFKKFFDKVEMTKPKASRFTSAETFVVGVGYKAPSYIDQKYFDPKEVFVTTDGDHFKEQMIGEYTSIDKIIQNRRNRGGYEDNAPMHLYKEASLTSFLQSDRPLLHFVEYNRIIVSEKERQQYYGLVKKMPDDIDELLKDLKVLGKNAIGGLMKWRGKIRHFLNQEREKTIRQELTEQNMMEEEVQEEEDSEEQLQKQLMMKQRKQLKKLRAKEDKKSEILIKSQAANQQLNENQQFGQQNLQEIFDGDVNIEELGFQEMSEEKEKEKVPKYFSYTPKQMEQNLEELYELRQKKKLEKQQHAMDVKRQKKQRRQQRITNAENKLKSSRFTREEKEEEMQAEEPEKEKVEKKKKKAQKTVEFESYKFQNPLADFDDEDIYISDEEVKQFDGQVDPDQKMEGQISDDDAYVIPKAETDMQKRRKKIKKTEKKKEKKLKKDIEDGQELYGQFQIVKHKTMDDYDINSLAETLAIGKKMIRNKSREQMYDHSYSRYNFEDHDQLPKWFTEDQKRHNFKQPPITKEQFGREKERLQAINARVPKKILQAKVRRKIRIQKKLKRTQKKAQNVMSQEGINEVSKLRQIGKMYDKSKRELKDNKKYVVSKKSKTVSGKDSRKVKHVDTRMKKDNAMSKKIKKTRHVKRKHKRRGKF